MGGKWTSCYRSRENEDLHYAAQYDLGTRMGDLFREGANVNARNQRGQTPLIAATIKENIQCMKLLINEGAHVNAVDRVYFHTAINYAAQQESGKCLQFLIKEGADVNSRKSRSTPLMNAVLYTEAENLRTLINAGADVNAIRNNQTALLLALEGCYVEGVKLLILAGADVNAVTDRNETGLIKASYRNDMVCAKLLLNAGAVVNVRSLFRQNAIETSIAHCKNNENSREFTMLLFAAGETTNSHIVRPKLKAVDIPQHLEEFMEPNLLCLTDMCRRSIRKHLMEINNVNLLVRISQLGLPTLLRTFLTYNVSMEIE